MKKWEYNVEHIIVSTDYDDTILEKMNEFGSKGWEIFNIIHTKSEYGKDRFVLYMKREIKLVDLVREYADETTTPRGVAPRYHIRNGNELWTWGPSGNFPRKIETFDTEEEAEVALYVSFAYDMDKECVRWSFTKEMLLEGIEKFMGVK